MVQHSFRYQDSSWCVRIRRRAPGIKYKYLIIFIILFSLLWLSINWKFTIESISMNVLKFNYNGALTSKDGYLEWTHVALPKRDLHAEHFVLGRDQDVYMYSAFVNPHEQSNKQTDSEESNRTIEVVITTLDKSRAKFNCCVIFNDRRSLLKVKAETYYENGFHRSTPTIYVNHQLTCRVPFPSSRFQPAFVTLTSSNCSSDFKDYLPILHPPRVPGGIALCAKIAHSGGLDPEKVIEWVEVQRLLGVDKILLFDLGNPDNLTRVFRYYQNLGILDVQPYELPGLPRNRSLHEQWKHKAQFNHDETMAVLECRQRMAGYDYIISHDVDEFIIPRRDVTLKDFLKELTQKEPNAAGFYFHTEFFITTWEPTNPEEDLMVTRYRMSTVPRWERYKYIYLPSRVKTSVTHNIYSYSKFTKPRVNPSNAVLHHYRSCPRDDWGTCTVKTIIDETMTRYHGLLERVLKVRSATSTAPRWKPVKSQGVVTVQSTPRK